MRRYTSTLRQKGQALILVVLAMLAMLGMAALAIDYAYLTVAKDQLRAAADAAALAGATQFGSGDVIATCIEFAAKNEVAGDLLTLESDDVTLGLWDFDNATLSQDGDPALDNAVTVTAGRTNSSAAGPLSVFFASILGITEAEVSVQATAAVDRRVTGIQGNGGLWPFLLDADTLGGIGGGGLEPPIGSTIDFYPDRGSAPGNFGMANLDGGSNGVPELVEWITYGYPDDVTIPADTGYLLVEGSPGFKNGTRSAVEARIGDTVVVLVYDQATGQGANSIFRVRSFCAIEITDVRMTGQMAQRYIRGVVRDLQSSVVTTGSGGMINAGLGSVCLVQ